MHLANNYHWFTNTFAQTVVISLSIVLLLLYPLIFLFLGLVWLYRFVIGKVVKWQDPKICRVLSGMDACIAAHDTYSPISILAPVYFLSSKVDTTKAINLLNEKVFKPKDNGGECIYPELKQRIIRKYGYNWWRNVDNFQVENHLRFIDENNPNKLYSRREIRDAFYEILKLPFNPALSPWQMIIVKNCYDENDPLVKSAIIFRFHHCLCDGYSVAKFTQSLAVNPWKDFAGNMNRTTGKAEYLQNLFKSTMIFIAFPYHLLGILRFSNDKNEWVERALAEYCNKKRFNDGKLIPLKVIKTIKDYHSVSFSSVVISLSTEAILKTMARESISVEQFTMGIPFPLEDHPGKLDHPGIPGKLTNHWSIAKLPINICKDNPAKTLQNIEKEFRKLRYSVKPLVSFHCCKLIGLLPIPLIPQLDAVMTGTCALSNVPGPAHEIDLLGYPVRTLLVGVNAPKGYAVATAFGSYNGNVIALTGGELSILKEEEDAEFFEKAHFDALHFLRADAEQNLIVD